MVAWTDNQNWGIPLQRDYCGYVSDRFTPCQHRRPCPIHEASPSRTEGARLTANKAPSVPPQPRLLELNQRDALVTQTRKEEP